MKRETRLPERAVRMIYEYDPTFHRDQFQSVLKEIPWTVAVWQMISEHRELLQAPAEGVEFKEEA